MSQNKDQLDLSKVLYLCTANASILIFDFPKLCEFVDVKRRVFTESHTDGSETHKPHSRVQSCYRSTSLRILLCEY